MRSKTLILLVFALSLEALGQAIGATPIPDRISLDSLLGGSAHIETFERFNLSNQPVLFLPDCVNASTTLPEQYMIPAQGPGLVVDGLTFCTSLHDMRIQGPFNSSQSQALWLVNGILSVTFSPPVNAFGFDYNPFYLGGTDVTVTLFRTDGTTLITSNTTRVFLTGTFIGYLAREGIGRIEISSVADTPVLYIFDTMIDNLAFGTSVLVPPSLKLTLIPSPKSVVLSWPTNATCFTLESTTNLGASTVWTTNLPSPIVVNGQYTVTNPISGSQQFFRLGK